MPSADEFCGINGKSVQDVKAIHPFPLLKKPYMVEVAYGYLDESKSDSILCNSALVVQISKSNKPSKERYNPFIFVDRNKRSVETLVFEDQMIDIIFIEMQHNDGVYYLSATFKKLGYWFHLNTWSMNLRGMLLDRTKVLEEIHQLIIDIEP